MIKLFRSKSLKELYETGKTAKIDARMHPRIIRRLDALKEAMKPEDMNLPGFNFHPLLGFNPTRYSVHVNGPWCVTFEFEGEHATQVDYEQYH
jgi:proteic killer suppression protein